MSFKPDDFVRKSHRGITSVASVGPDPLKGTPWEKVAERIPDGASVEEILKAAHLDWEVAKLPVYTELEVATETGPAIRRIGIDKSFTILRLDTLKPVSPFTGPRYKLIQNREAFESFEQFCMVGNLTIETAGMLSDGKHVWALASMGEGIELVDGEVIKGYFLLLQSHYYGHSLKAMFTPIRYPGGHTIVKALNVKGKPGFYTMPHSRHYNDARKGEIEELVERAEESLETYARRAKFLANADITEADGVFYLTTVFDEKLLKKIKKYDLPMPETYEELREHPDSNRLVRSLVDLIPSTPGADLPSCRGTAWGLFNTVLYGIDKAWGLGDSTRLESAWIGKNAPVKVKAMNTAVTLAASKPSTRNIPDEVVLEIAEEVE